MDGIVGQFMERLKEGDLLMVMSDHGFHSFRTEFNVNKWLIDNGYLAVKGGGKSTGERFLQGFDWTKTKAYGLGLGMIFINMKGREGNGIVEPADAPALIEEIRGKLMAVTDPGTGEKVFREVYPYINPKGEATADTPDLQLGYAEGYQTAKASASGAAPAETFSPNKDKWSGEHASSDVAFTQGILFSNQKVQEGATLLDLGVTAFNHLGLQAPASFEGKNLLP
jgi:predicted AlkP superfamily phosphohydrolase/phosphomutase